MRFPLFWSRFGELRRRRQVMRGRVHKIGIVAGGEVSVVIRFGIDEPNARWLQQGALVELQEVERGEVQQSGEGRSCEAGSGLPPPRVPASGE